MEQSLRKAESRRQPEKFSSQKGVSVFVNFVSKRIHPRTPREAFKGYGRLVDVYIAYKNVSRLGLKSTFAFVRFASRKEALLAVQNANNRLMDGFKINVFLDKKTSPQRKAQGRTSDGEPLAYKKVGVISDFVDGRTFKDVMMGYSKKLVLKVSAERKDESNVSSFSEEKPKVLVPILAEPLQIEIVEGEKTWLKNCLVGQISAMYDAGFVQQVMCSEGFKVKVCQWFGYYAIIWFEEEEHIEIFWDLRNSTLKVWFDDVDTVENFSSSQKLWVWLSIEGLPLEAWLESNLNRIASRWGKVIKIDPETVAKSRLDRARILSGVNCL
ncbi:hypothetical protein V6N11_067489 [Hibiscus sabdariffa]|uniref:RRM domain-containing protein n=1 Tax=Hibiscus sabdariffa TaxID=183260 RepID=A0ABR2SRJ0_9ROSI